MNENGAAKNERIYRLLGTVVIFLNTAVISLCKAWLSLEIDHVYSLVVVMYCNRLHAW